jgi:hypothetical protein
MRGGNLVVGSSSRRCSVVSSAMPNCRPDGLVAPRRFGLAPNNQPDYRFVVRGEIQSGAGLFGLESGLGPDLGPNTTFLQERIPLTFL